MIIIGLCIIIAIMIALHDIGRFGIGTVLFGSLFGLILSEMACGLFYTDDSNINILSQNNTNIYSLSGVNGVSGSFTFGTGTVESKPVYY